MRTIKLLIFSSLLFTMGFTHAQNNQYEATIENKSGSIYVHYFENAPAAYLSDGQLKGIEIDILEDFRTWINKNKGIDITFDYQAYTEFDELYNSIKEGEGNQMGIGTIAITDKRTQEVDFSAPYMKNLSILVTAGAVKTARTKEELKELLGIMQAVTVKGSIHEEHLIQLYREYKVEPKIKYIKDPMEVFAQIKDSPRNFGYVDVITFWKYLKTSDQYVKMHSIANYKNENFGFIFPKNSGWASQFNEFFESGFGYTATKAYHKILEKHLSYEVLNSVELNP